MSILPTLKSDSKYYTEATPSLYGSDEDSDVEQDIGIEQVKEQDSQVVQGQHLTVERMCKWALLF